MLVAFSWWSVLLFTKNRDAFYAKRDLMHIGMIAEHLVHSDEEFLQTAEYEQLAARYERQEWMIFGEAAVFVVSLIIGVYLINRGYHKEMKASEQRRNFLLSITHELKSPIASIKLVLETFLKRDLNKKQSTKFTKNALKDTERLNNLVNDLLLSAKLETAYQPYFEPLDLVELIEDLIAKLSTKHLKSKFFFEKNDAIPTIQADKMGLTSVALNLLENAVKYGDTNPEITTTLSLKNNEIIWKVADNGIGISDKEKGNVFEKFYRVGSEETRTTKGTGLGLYIVKEIIGAHGGTIKVVDNQPKGTEFVIRLTAEDYIG
ncbi:MAG: signal transduction histidine kinase [Saprospiraceae bacterium]|jgi:signal transduction histidine kinase